MSPPDDIRPEDVNAPNAPAAEGLDAPAPKAPAKPLRQIGPESEVRGGHEAPLDDICEPQQ